MPLLLRPADVLATREALYGFALEREGPLRRSGRRITNDGVILDEAYDDVLRRTFTRWPGPMKRGEAFGWLRTVMVNRTQDLCESRATAKRRAPELVEGEATPDHAVDVTERSERAFLLHKARGWLTEREWTAFRLQADGATYAQIGEKLGLAESGVDALLCRARGKCDRKRRLLNLSPVPMLAALRRRLRPVIVLPLLLLVLAVMVPTAPWGDDSRASASGEIEGRSAGSVFRSGVVRPTWPSMRRVSVPAPSLERSRVLPGDGDGNRNGGDRLLGLRRLPVTQRPAVTERSSDPEESMVDAARRCARRAVEALPALELDPCRPG